MTDYSFDNIQIDQKTLPTGKDIIFQPLDPRYFTSALCIWSFITLILSILLGLLWFDIIPGLGDSGLEKKITIKALLLISMIILLLVAVFNLAEIRSKGYALRTYDVAAKKGLLFRSVTTIPFSRVQHIEINRGPILRIFGLSSLLIYTAGGISVDLHIPGLKTEDASALRLKILQRIHEINLGSILEKDDGQSSVTVKSAEKEAIASGASEEGKIFPVSL